MQHQMDSNRMPPASFPHHSQQVSNSESHSTGSASRAIRPRSLSHPIKAAFANEVLPCPVGSVDLASSTTHPPSMGLLNLDRPNLDITNKTSAALRFKSTLFSSPSNPQISGDYNTRILNPIHLLEITHRKSELCVNDQPTPTSPVNPNARGQPIKLELIDQDVTPASLSAQAPLFNQSTKERSRQRRWSVQRSKNTNQLDLNDKESLNLNPLNLQAVGSWENGEIASNSHHITNFLNGSREECLSYHPSDPESFATQSLLLPDHSNQPPNSNQISDVDCSKEESFDLEDLATPTLKNCERFEDDNSITPCQTFSTSKLKNIQQAIRITPRMIYEDYQRKFNEEDVIIKSSRASKLSPCQPSSSHESLPVKTRANNSAETDVITGPKSNHQFSPNKPIYTDDAMSNTAFLSNASLGGTSFNESADESFESFGDDQIFDPPFEIKSHFACKPNSQLIAVFPMPPVIRSQSCFPSNVQRTPSPKQMVGQGSKTSTPDSTIPRIVMDIDETDLKIPRRITPLVLGKPLTAKPSIKNHVPRLERRLSNSIGQEGKPFQLPPSPYRHVENSSRVHDGPDHLESSTRMMSMFDSFLERSPKNSGSNMSARSSLSKKSDRKLKLDESPLKQFRRFNSAETPELILRPQRSFVRESSRLDQAGAPLNLPDTQSTSGVNFKSSKNPNLDVNASLTATDSTPLRKRLPNVRSLLSFQDCCPPLSVDPPNKYLSRHVEHPSPASDSEDELSQSPKTPFGNVFNPSNQLEPYVPTFESNLSVKSLAQKLVFKAGAYDLLDSQPHSVEGLEGPGSLHLFSNLGQPMKHKENLTRAFKYDEMNAAIPSQGQKLKHRSSIAKFMSSGLLSKFTNQKYPRGSFFLGDSIGNSKKDHQANSPTDEGFDSSPHKSNWSSILEHQFDQSRVNSSLDVLNSSRQNASTISGRILFEESDDVVETPDTNFMRNHRGGSSTCGTRTPNRSGKEKVITHAPGSRQEGSRNAFEQEQAALVKPTCQSTEGVSKDPQQILSPIRLYGKQQGVLETGNWKTNNLNFQSMKSQYQATTSKNGDRSNEVKIYDESAAKRRDRTLTEETQKKGAEMREEDEEAEKEKKESLMVYKIQEEDDNQIINFEINRLKKIFYNKALKSSKSKSKLSKPLVKLFNQ